MRVIFRTLLLTLLVALPRAMVVRYCESAPAAGQGSTSTRGDSTPVKRSRPRSHDAHACWRAASVQAACSGPRPPLPARPSWSLRLDASGPAARATRPLPQAARPEGHLRC